MPLAYDVERRTINAGRVLVLSDSNQDLVPVVCKVINEGFSDIHNPLFGIVYDANTLTALVRHIKPFEDNCYSHFHFEITVAPYFSVELQEQLEGAIAHELSHVVLQDFKDEKHVDREAVSRGYKRRLYLAKLLVRQNIPDFSFKGYTPEKLLRLRD